MWSECETAGIFLAFNSLRSANRLLGMFICYRFRITHAGVRHNKIDKMIDSDFIEKWEPKYDEIESDQDEYVRLVKRVSDEVNDYQTIKLETFKQIIDWKSSRAKGYVKWDNYNIYQKTFRQILNQKFPTKMRSLDALPGIGPAVASTILHFIYPDVFPIYDFRTVEVLKYFSYLTSKTVSQAQYPKFQEIILKIRKNLVYYNLRHIDRALFAFHKSNPNIFKNICELKKNRYNLNHKAAGLTTNVVEGNKSSRSIPEIRTLGTIPREGDFFKGQINDLSLNDKDGWRRRDIWFFKHNINGGKIFDYPKSDDEIVLIDTSDERYELRFSKPDLEKKVCLGTPSKLKPWYKKKGYDDHSVRSNNQPVYFQFTGHRNEFIILTEREYNSRIRDVMP